MEKQYKSFLAKLEAQGLTEFDFIKFLRNYYFPGTPSQIHRSKSIDSNFVTQNRDFSKYSFMDKKNLKKRQVVHVVVSYLLREKNIEVSEINSFASEHKLTPKTRPFVNELNDIPHNLLNRYFSKAKDLIELKGKSYAVYNQFGGSEFDELCELFNSTFKTKILKQ